MEARSTRIRDFGNIIPAQCLSAHPDCLSVLRCGLPEDRSTESWQDCISNTRTDGIHGGCVSYKQHRSALRSVGRIPPAVRTEPGKVPKHMNEAHSGNSHACMHVCTLTQTHTGAMHTAACVRVHRTAQRPRRQTHTHTHMHTQCIYKFT